MKSNEGSPISNGMNPQTSRAKDFFLNLGATISLYVVVIFLVNLLFTIINFIYPKITNAYYYSSSSISWPVATLVIFTPILITLMWILGKQYVSEPVSTIHKWLSYLTLFLAGGAIAGDLITVLYYFIDGQEMGTAFLLKAGVLLVITLGLFGYYLTDIRGKLTGSNRMIWRVFSIVIVVASIVWGFSTLGSPATQKLYKYDAQKITDLQNISYQVQNYYSQKGSMPETLAQAADLQYSTIPVDVQSGKAYEYQLVGQSAKAYKLCADFNFASDSMRSSVQTVPYAVNSWNHPVGHFCFDLAIPVDMYKKVI